MLSCLESSELYKSNFRGKVQASISRQSLSIVLLGLFKTAPLTLTLARRINHFLTYVLSSDLLSTLSSSRKWNRSKFLRISSSAISISVMVIKEGWGQIEWTLSISRVYSIFPSFPRYGENRATDFFSRCHEDARWKYSTKGSADSDTEAWQAL